MFCTKKTYLDLVYFLFIGLYYCYLISCILCVFHTIDENLHDSMGKPKKEIRSQHNYTKASTPPIVEHNTTEGYVNQQLYLEDQGVV